MANKIERLSFTRRRLVSDIKHQASIIEKMTEETTVPLMLSRKDALESLWSDFKRNIDAIENTRDWVGTQEFIDENSELHDSYVNALVKLLEILPDDTEALQQSLTAFRRNPPSLSAEREEPEQQSDDLLSSTRHARPIGIPTTVTLPTLQIKPFSGDLLDWPEFKATCEGTFVHIADQTTRFRYLKSFLVGEAAQLVKHLPLTENSYAIAYKLLQKRYDNERAIINANLNRMLELPTLKNESADGLKTMFNTVNESIAALGSFNVQTDSWDSIIILMLTKRLDSTSSRNWEEKLQGKRTVPKLSEFLEFLETRISILKKTEATHATSSENQGSRKQKILLTSTKKCTICGEQTHFAYLCPELTSKSTSERVKFIREKGLCINCFHAHKVEECTSRFSCKVCQKRHNSVLHSAEAVFNVITQEQQHEQLAVERAITAELEIEHEEMQALEMAQVNIHTVNISDNENHSETILATAMVKIAYENRVMFVRALIDQGSTANLISYKICKALGLPEIGVNIPITCVGGHVTYKVTKKTSFTLRSIINDSFSTQVPALIVPRITTLNSSQIQDSWEHLANLPLADPQSHKINRIDVLLGAATFAQIILKGLVKGAKNEPIAQQTELGWIISGNNPCKIHNQITPVLTLTTPGEDLSQSLLRFWEDEEIPKNKMLTTDEKRAEEIYASTTKRCDDGRYMVRLPFKGQQDLGESLSIAKRRLNSLNRRLNSNPEFRIKYNACIQEYIDLGHMESVNDITQIKYFLPHHAVVKEASSTTKIRPVFDASCKTSNGKSLNSELLIGPTIQPDLFSLMIGWRKNKYAITGDIEKMYRQIWVHPDDAKYQGLLWQSDDTPPGNTPPDQPKSYCLKTVTFGVASAPFLAIRTLYQIAIELKMDMPTLSEKIQNNFYVDDFFDSTETVDEAKETIRLMTEKLAEYGFPLRKWKSNNDACLQDLHENEKDISTCSLFKTLGIQWDPNSDCFVFLPTELSNEKEWTKRKILSDICKLFDPMGWLQPCLILAKIFMQKLWLLQLGWDEQIPTEIASEWTIIQQQFKSSCSVKIPRWIGFKLAIIDASLQGFADASEAAYGCVIYIRIVYDDGTILCTLLSAKTRVAPLKKITIPRLELNAAVLLSSLMDKVKSALKIPNLKLQAWSDSAIVLYWLAGHPSRWKTYIAHRVSDIQQILPSHLWRHIDSTQNPADCASRGLMLNELERFKLWWQGPDFLRKPECEWPERIIALPSDLNLEEKRKVCILHMSHEETNSIIARFSHYDRLLRFSVRAFRWLEKIRAKTKTSISPFISQPISIDELQNAEKRLIQLVQAETFLEISQLQKAQPISNKSKIRNLAPYLDSEQIMRVGGRLELSHLSMDEKHPIILPPKHNFTIILIRKIHRETLHGGLAITMQTIRQKFWIINARRVVNSVIYKCITCFRFRKVLLQQKMGNIPAYRLQEAIPFTFVGIDYAGYFEVKASQRKNAPYVKAYVALFICLTTRAIHLELVSDLSSTQFLKAFKRFIGRRGIPKKIFSDNATTFIGADREIRELLEKALQQVDSELKELLLKNRIEWSTIPARAPHFGGWESGVKLMKHHLKRVLGKARLCFEDFNTLIIEIEAVVNSRPIWAIPSTSEEYEALTPGHFLVFKPLNTLPEPNTSHIPENRLSQYQYLHHLVTDFWKIWSKEYLQTLQVRKKWFDAQPNIQIGQIVLVSEDNETPTQWSLGRVTNIHQGSDCLIRVADIRCRQKVLRRPIHKLSLLPILDNQENIKN